MPRSSRARQPRWARTTFGGCGRPGLDDVAIHDATQIIGFFNYINRVADALGVEPERFVKPWGEG